MQTKKDHSYEPTSDPDLFRFCDRNGDWRYYFIKSIEKYVPSVTHVLDVAFNKGRGFMNYLLSVSKEEAKKKLEETGEEGSRIHQAISDLIKGMKVTDETKYMNEVTGRQEVLNADEWDCVKSFVQWVNDYKPQTIGNEVSVHSSLYAGTYDWLGVIEVKGKLIKILMDWKSSAAIYGDYALQVAPYQYSLPDNKDVYTGILRLGTRHKCGYEFKVWDPKETRSNFDRFISVRKLFDYIEGPFEPKIEEIPSEFKVEIPKYVEPIIRNKKQKQLCLSKTSLKTTKKNKGSGERATTSRSKRRITR